MTNEDADEGYLSWTNSLLTKLRAEAKRADKLWAYASVTERQKRGHPHSHYITTYCPIDAIPIAKGEGKTFITSGEIFPAKHTTLQSFSLERRCVQSGLGRMYDFSTIENIEGASRYAAKYLFKETIFNTIWPKGWKRVRYSQNWPKLPDVKGDSMLLLTFDDWQQLARKALIVVTKDEGASKVAKHYLSHADVIIQ